MKLTTITALIYFTFTLNLFSQVDVDADLSLNAAGEEETGGDTTVISLGKHNIIIVENPDNEDKEKDKSVPAKDDDDFKIHWSGIDLGVNGYLNKDNTLSVPQNYEFLQLNYSKSLAVSLNFLEKNIRLYQNHITIATGLGVDFNMYSFKNNTTLRSNNDSLWAVTDTVVNFQKNKLKTVQLKLPLMLGFSTNKDSDKSFHLAAGIVLGYKLGSKTKQLFKQDGEKHKPKVKGDFHIAPFNYNATVRMGYGNFKVYANYALSPLFDKGKGPELYPFSVGITLSDI